MELIRYWHIVRRHWWLIAALVAIVGISSLLTYDWSPPQEFTASLRFNVGIEPVPPDDAEYVYNPLDTWRSAEYLMDDLASAVRGSEYARRVAARLDQENVNLAGAFGAATEFRVLTISVRWGDREQLERIVNAAIKVLDGEGRELVGPLGRARPVLRLIDPPVVVPVGPSLTDKLELPIRLGLAVLAGVAGAFLLDYIDVSVRSGDELENMGIAVLAQIPRRRKGSAHRPKRYLRE
jgi:capsular polysaccharide biosynthesis protein